MKRSHYYISLDIRDSEGACQLDMNRGDTHRRLHIRLTDGGNPYPVDPGVFAVFTARRPDNTVLFNTCQVVEGQILYDLTPQTTALEGVMDCQVRLYHTEGLLPLLEDGAIDLTAENIQLLSSAAFRIRVLPTVYNETEALAPMGEVSALNAAIAAANAVVAAKEKGELNGISATHSWNGTVLTVTTASGTSSADLKGPVPIRGVHYWTEDDIAQIKAYVDQELGDVELALDHIITMEDHLIGGDSL